MEYNGLLQKFPVNRPLTEDERRLKLEQKKSTGLEPLYQLSVIRMNSTFLEMVDKYYAWKGTLVTITVPIMVGVTAFFMFMLLIPPSAGRAAPPFWFYAAMATMPLPLLAFLIWLFFREAFAYTHYPIRMDRKSQMVHVFRLDGSVLSVAWDSVFFCLAKCTTPFQWDVRGHILDVDGRTVRETFSLSDWGAGAGAQAQLRGYWEFVRLYMEGGVSAVDGCVRFCLPIAERRETVMFGFQRMFAEAAGQPLPLRVVGALLAALSLPGRWVAMRSSRIPLWPTSIEAATRIDRDDRHVKDASTNPLDLL